MKNLLPKAPLFVSISSRKCGRLKNMLPKSPLSVGIAISKLGKLKICSQNPHCFPLLTILSHFGGLLRKIPKLNICSRNPHCSKVRNTSEGGFAPLQKSAPKIPTVLMYFYTSEGGFAPYKKVLPKSPLFQSISITH